MANPITLRKDLEIGAMDANNDDKFLFDCFVDLPALSDIKNTASPKMILLGSTGIGKTALIRKIEKDCKKNVSSIELGEMALSYVQNNDAIQFLVSLGVDLRLFFQGLWKHVILIEYIKLKFNINSEQKYTKLFNYISDKFKTDQSKQKSIAYLEKWHGKFFAEMSQNILEITETLGKNIEAKFGAHIEKYNVNAGYGRTMSAEKKSHLQRQARQFVNSELLQDLAKIIDMFSDLKLTNNSEKYYILIDKLDENWADPEIKYSFIRELIESLKNLRRIGDLKVVVALRSDLFEKVIKETKDDGFQSEKYEDYIIRLEWNSDLLKKLVDKRINLLFKRQYTREDVKFTDVFPEKLTNSDGAWSAIMDRSLNRPRDVINFINICLSNADGESKISRPIFVKAEREYSKSRYDALIEEWSGTIRGIEKFFVILKRKKPTFTLHEICTQDLLSDLVKDLPESESKKPEKLWRLVDEATKLEKTVEPLDLACVLIERLHLIGAVGVKVSAESSYDYFYKTHKQISTNQLNFDTKIQIHKMLRPALGIIQPPTNN